MKIGYISYKNKTRDDRSSSTEEDSNEKNSFDLEDQMFNENPYYDCSFFRKTFKNTSNKEIIIWIVKNYLLFGAIQVINKKYTSKVDVCNYDNLNSCIESIIIPGLYRWVFEIVAFSFFYSGVLILSVMGKFSKLIQIYLIWNLLTLMGTSEYQGFGHYSAFVGSWLIYLVIIFTFSFASILCLFWISRKFPTLAFVCIFAFVGYIGNKVYEKVYTNCETWYDGIGGHSMVAKYPTCRVEKPNFCYFDFVGDLFDFSKHAGYECSKASVSLNAIKRYYPNAPVIGFPRMENIRSEDKLFWSYPGAVMNNLAHLQTINDPQAKNLEIFLDQRDSQNPKIVINVKRNETLAQERKEILSDPLAKNVIAIYVDAVSRRSAIRNLPKTMKWFEDYIDDKSPKAETYQFFKYHGITPWTFHVNLAMMYGFDAGEATPESWTQTLPKPETPHKHFVSDFKEKGFVTARSASLCHQSGLYTPDANFSNYVDEMTFDHEGSNYACDPHFHDYDRPYVFYQGSNSYIRRCMYGKDANEYNFEYGEQFWNAYSDQKKLLWLHLFDGHEGTQNVIKYLDNPLSGFLNRLQQAGKLDDTVVMLVSDHGLHQYIFDAARLFQSTLIERALPALFLRLPKDLSRDYALSLKSNEENLVSAYDVHNFMRSLPNGRASIFIEKSFLESFKLGKTCQTVNVHGQDCYCT